jgi:hypothetical protein
MLRVGFETAISAGERPQTYALDWAATEISTHVILNVLFIIDIIVLQFLKNKLRKVTSVF